MFPPSDLNFNDVERSAFETAKEAHEKIYGALKGYGWRNPADVKVVPARTYGASGWETLEGEFDVDVTHPNAPGGQSYYSRVKGAPNETLLRRQGKGFQHYTGDLREVTAKGMDYLKPTSSPYYTGIQSFARRIAGGLGETLVRKEQFPKDDAINWQDEVRRIDNQQNRGGGLFVTPVKDPKTGEYIPIRDRIPASAVTHEAIASKENIRFQSQTYGVPNIAPGDEWQGGVAALHRQVIEWGQTAASKFAPLFGGGVHEPSHKTGGRYITARAAGSLRVSDQGIVAADTIAETSLKHTYSVGRRPVADLGYLAGTRLTKVPDEFLDDSSLTLRAGEKSDPGLRMQAVTAVTPQTLPWQSGQMQLQLPQKLKSKIVGGRGQLVAMTEARRQLQLEGVGGPADLLKVPFKLSQEYVGKTLPQGSQFPIDVVQPDLEGLDPKTPAGKAEIASRKQRVTTRGITPGNQVEQIQGYTLMYPRAWANRMSEDQLGTYFEKLKEKGFTNFSPHSKEQPMVQVDMLSATSVGPKGGGAKGQVDVPLTVSQRMERAGRGSLPYDVLQEAKHPEAVVYNALQAMPKKQIPELLATIYKGNTQMTPLVETAQAMAKEGTPLSLEAIGSSVFQTGEQTLLSVSDALHGYGNQDELIKRFGLGYTKGRVPVNQYTPETFKYLRRYVMDELTNVPDKAGNVMNQKQAMRVWSDLYRKQSEFDPKTGLYTHYAEQEFLYHPKKQTFHMETVGVGSTQGELELGMEAQGFPGIKKFIRSGFDKLFPETPARWGIKQIARGWMATQHGEVVEPGQTRVVTPEKATNIQNLLGQMILDPKYADRGKLGAMEAYGDAMRQTFKLGEKAEPLFHFPTSETTIAGAGAFAETESLLMQLRGEGSLVPETQAHVATRWVKTVSQLLESERAGVPDLEAKLRAQQLSGTYIDSEQIRKSRGGIFARYGGSTLLMPGTVAMSKDAMKRHYLMQGGNIKDKAEYQRYKEIMKDVTSVGIRAPAPNIGSEGMPGSVFPLITKTPDSPIGQAIFGQYEKAGIRPPDFFLSAMQRAQQGDVDLDPATLLPLAFRTKPSGEGRSANWVRYQGEGDYGEWMRKVVAQQEVPAQRNTFQTIFGANATNFDPWGSRMREAIGYSMGQTGKSLLDKRLVTESQDIQSNIELWNRVKQREMGSQYNALLRRSRVAATTLGVPAKDLVFGSDVGIEPYQASIDLDIPDGTWSALMGTSGFFPQARAGGKMDLNWGWNAGFGGDKADFGQGMTYWSPKRDTKELASHIGRILSSGKNPNANFIASMTMQMPRRQLETGRRGDEEMSNIIRQRRETIAGALQPALDIKGDERFSAINKVVEGLSEQGLIGERSIGVQSLMARSLEYMNKDATRKQMTLEAIDQQGGLLMGGKRVSSADWVKQTQPLTTLMSWQKHEPGVAAPYKNVLDIAELMLASEQGAYRDAPLMEEFTRQWGEMAGFTPGRQLSVVDPYDPEGKPRVITRMEDINELRTAQAQQRTKLVDQWVQGGGEGAVRRLSFSALGSQAAIAESGNVYEDMYNQSLTGAMMYAFRNPILGTEGTGVDVRAPQELSRYFKSGSKFTAAGDRVERMFTAANRTLKKPLGSHIGQITDYGKAPRYEVAGKGGTRYDIAGIPDFLKFSRGKQAGQYNVDVYDVKNLSSLKGMKPGAAIQSIMENPAYATQVPGYQTMFADIGWLRGDTEGATNMRSMVREQLKGDPDQTAMFEEYLEKGTDINARGAYLASRFTPEEAMRTGKPRRGMIQGIQTGVKKLLAGASSYAGGKYGPQMVRAQMPDITTAGVPAQQEVIVEQAGKAQGMARQLALQASLYQSHAIKTHIMGDEGLQLQYGPQKFTEAETEAVRFWTTKGREGETRYAQRNPLEIRSDIAPQDLYRLQQAVGINLATLSGGEIPTTREQLTATGMAAAGGAGGGDRPRTPITTDFPDPEPEEHKRRTTKDIQKQLDITEELRKEISNIAKGKGGVRTWTGRADRLTAKQASRFFGATKGVFSELIGTEGKGGEFVPGKLTEAYGQIPQQLAERLGAGGEAIAQMPPNLAIQSAAALATERGVAFSKLIKGTPVESTLKQFGAVEGMVRTVLPHFGELDPKVTGGRGSFAMRAMNAMFGGGEKDESTLGGRGMMPMMGNMRADMLELKKLNTNLTAGGKPAGEFGSISDAWISQLGKATTMIEQQTASLVKSEGGFKNLSEMMDKASESSEEMAKKVEPRREALMERQLTQWERAVGVRDLYGQTKGYPMPKGAAPTMTPEELAFISDQGVSTGEQGVAVKKYMQSKVDVAQARRAAAYTAAGKAVPGEAGGMSMKGFGRMGRSMLGGFGLMYMRSVYDIATQGSQVGLQPWTAQQQTIQQQFGQLYGGVPRIESGQEALMRSQAPYGGAGMQSFQRLQASMYQDPRKATTLSAGGAAIAAIGAGTWMGSMIGMPWLGLAGAPIAAAGALGLQAYGARTEPEISGAGMASRLWTGELTPERLAELTKVAGSAEGNWGAQGFNALLGRMAEDPLAPDTITRKAVGWAAGLLQDVSLGGFIGGGEFDATQAGWLGSPEGIEITNKIAQLKAVREKQEEELPREERQTWSELMRDAGWAEQEIGRYEGYLATAGEEGFEGRVPFEGIVGAQALESRYGIALEMGEGKGFETLGIAMAQGAAWPQAATQLAGTSFMSRTEREGEIGKLLEKWGDVPPTSGEVNQLLGGKKRYEGLGVAAPQVPGGQEGLEAYWKQLEEMPAQAYTMFQQEFAMGKQYRQMGLPWETPEPWDFKEMDQEQMLQYQREQGVRQIQAQRTGQAYQGLLALGLDQPVMMPYHEMGAAELTTNVQQISGALGIQQQMLLAGAPQRQTDIFGQALGQMQGQEGRTMLGVLQGDRKAWSRFALETPDQFAALPDLMQGLGGSMIDKHYMGMTDIVEGPGGQQTMTGMQWGASSLAMPGLSSAAMAGRIWGEGFAGRSDVNQGLIGAMVEGGTFGGQAYQLQQQSQYQQAMAGIQMEQIALNRRFQTGVGIGQYNTVNPQTGQPFGFNKGAFNVDVKGVGGFRTQGGGMWGIQDAQRGLGYMQQEWTFGRQEQQVEMQDRNWQQNFDLNRRGAMMQRPWKREDWAYQDTTRALQWQWKREDFEEESRFMTGRDRRLAERQMGRETIMYGLEGEQIDKGRERQQDLWNLEDERFLLQEAQHKESIQFQEEGIKMQKRFFEERKRLELEQQKLQRAFQIEQMALSEKQAGLAAAYAATQAEMALTMQEFSQFAQKAMAEGSLFNEDTLLGIADALEEVNPALAEHIRVLVDAMEELGEGSGWLGMPPEPESESDDDDEYEPTPEERRADREEERIPRQHGGQLLAGQLGLVGEAGPEHFKPYFTGDVLPSYKTNPFEATMISPQADKGEKKIIHLVLNLGDEHFKDYIIDTVDQEIDV